jgi:hypothetical protein
MPSFNHKDLRQQAYALSPQYASNTQEESNGNEHATSCQVPPEWTKGIVFCPKIVCKPNIRICCSGRHNGNGDDDEDDESDNGGDDDEDGNNSNGNGNGNNGNSSHPPEGEEANSFNTFATPKPLRDVDDLLRAATKSKQTTITPKSSAKGAWKPVTISSDDAVIASFVAGIKAANGTLVAKMDNNAKPQQFRIS